jgi:hypothetical protein
MRLKRKSFPAGRKTRRPSPGYLSCRLYGMALKFRHKVFLTLLLNSGVIVVCLILISGYFASRNFENYINKMENARLKAMAQILSQEYQKSHSWAPVVADLDYWLKRMGRERHHHHKGKGGPKVTNAPSTPISRTCARKLPVFSPAKM